MKCEMLPLGAGSTRIDSDRVGRQTQRRAARARQTGGEWPVTTARHRDPHRSGPLPRRGPAGTTPCRAGAGEARGIRPRFPPSRRHLYSSMAAGGGRGPGSCRDLMTDSVVRSLKYTRTRRALGCGPGRAPGSSLPSGDIQAVTEGPGREST